MDISREFLITSLNIGTFIQFLAAIISTIYYRKCNNTILKYFPILLWYTFLNEIAGILFIEYFSRFNAIIYNIYHLINFTVLFLIFKNFLITKKHKNCIKIFIIIYIGSYIINGFFENYLVEFLSWPYIIASSFLIVCISFYFIEILNSQKVLSVKKNLLVWISIGLLIYYIGNIPFKIVKNYYTDIDGITILFFINVVLTIIMNICFIIGFIWSDRKQLY